MTTGKGYFGLELPSAETGKKRVCLAVAIQGEHTMAADKRSNEQGSMRGTSPENYCLMNEEEKDLEIEKAVDRLQKRIQAILYLFEQDKTQTAGALGERKTGSPS